MISSLTYCVTGLVTLCFNTTSPSWESEDWDEASVFLWFCEASKFVDSDWNIILMATGPDEMTMSGIGLRSMLPATLLRFT